MGKAFASPRRLELLDLLAQAPRTVDELARASGQSTANASQHLQALHAAGHGHARARGHERRYALAGDEALRAVARAARRLGRAAGRGRARRARLPRRRRRGDRPRRADRAPAQGRRRARRRAPAARSSRPATSRARARSRSRSSSDRLAELPADREIVAYCRGPFCAYAHDAVRRLNAAGRPARRLEDGWPEWRLASPDHVDRGGRRMTAPTGTPTLDTSELEQRVKRMYEEVALEPERDFHFETGRPLAERLGYPPGRARPHPRRGDRLVRRRRLLPRPRRARARRDRARPRVGLRHGQLPRSARRRRRRARDRRRHDRRPARQGTPARRRDRLRERRLPRRLHRAPAHRGRHASTASSPMAS